MRSSLFLSVCLLSLGLACTDARRPSTPPVSPPSPPAVPADAGPTGPAPTDAGVADAGVADAGGDCSARGLSATPAASPTPLPPAVESMRRRIVAAAVACDYAALVALADERSKGLRFTFGPGTDLTAFWREQEAQGVPILARLVKILNLPSFHKDGLFWWPTAYRDNATDKDYTALKGIYPDAQVEALRSERMYYFLRVGIKDDGDWEFAVSGD